MSDAKHTPGPWEANYTTVDGAIVRWHISSQKHGSAYPVCEHMIESAPESSEQIANARLIAAAPDMLSAIKTSVGNVRSLCATNPGAFTEWLALLETVEAQAEVRA